MNKFKDATSLEKAYMSLEKEFTKKCQELSALKGLINNNSKFDSGEKDGLVEKNAEDQNVRNAKMTNFEKTEVVKKQGLNDNQTEKFSEIANIDQPKSNSQLASINNSETNAENVNVSTNTTNIPENGAKKFNLKEFFASSKWQEKAKAFLENPENAGVDKKQLALKMLTTASLENNLEPNLDNILAKIRHEEISRPAKINKDALNKDQRFDDKSSNLKDGENINFELLDLNFGLKKSKETQDSQKNLSDEFYKNLSEYLRAVTAKKTAPFVISGTGKNIISTKKPQFKNVADASEYLRNNNWF